MRHLTVQQLSASLDGALVGVSLELVVRHLATCRECRARHARLSKQDDTLRHLLAWDPGAEYFEDASIRLETILDAESRGVAPPRIAEIEAQLPRVTLEDVLRIAPVPNPEPTPSPKPAIQFPSWMQPATNRPVTPRPVPREPRKPTPPLEPVATARKEPPVIVPVIIPAPEPEPIAVAAPEPAPMPASEALAEIIAEPRPVAASVPAPEPIAELVPQPVPVAAPQPATPPTLATRRAMPRWMRPLAFTAVGVTALIAALSALPPVIRIPEPELPRFPRIELVKRQPRDTREAAQSALAPARPQSTPTASVVPPVPVTAVPAVIQPVATEPEPRGEIIHEPSPAQPPPHVAPSAARQSAPPRAAPAAAIPAPTPQVEPTATPTEVDPAADWPLLCGEVLDDTGAPVAGARVLLADLDLGARTDKRGRFCLAAPPGDRTLSVIALGFAAARQVVSLGTQTVEVRIALHPTP